MHRRPPLCAAVDWPSDLALTQVAAQHVCAYHIPDLVPEQPIGRFVLASQSL